MATPLKLEREKRGITTEQVAIAVGVKQPTMSRVENGVKRASPELAKRISAYFNNAVTRDQILYPEEYIEGAKKRVRSAARQEAV